MDGLDPEQPGTPFRLRFSHFVKRLQTERRFVTVPITVRFQWEHQETALKLEVRKKVERMSVESGPSAKRLKQTLVHWLPSLRFVTYQVTIVYTAIVTMQLTY
jgi:hypothetical protein